MLITVASKNLGVRSSNKQSVGLQKVVTIPAVQGMGSVFTDIQSGDFSSATGYLGYIAGAGLLLYLMFGSNRAKERRAALKTAAEHYRTEKQSVYSKFGRI
jgi:hypothetical protein